MFFCKILSIKKKNNEVWMTAFMSQIKIIFSQKRTTKKVPASICHYNFFLFFGKNIFVPKFYKKNRLALALQI